VRKDKYALIIESLALYKKSFRYTFPFSLGAAFLVFAPQLFFSVASPLMLPKLEESTKLLTLTTLCWGSGVWFLSSLILRLHAFYYQIPARFCHVFKEAFFKLIPVLLLGAFYFLMVLSATMLLIIPGAILCLSLLFSFILLLTENQNVLPSLLMSHRLVWGHWWHTFSMISFAFLLNIAFSLAAFVSITLFFLKLGYSFSQLYFFIFLINMLIQVFFIPFIFSVAFILLHDLKQRQPPRMPRW